MPPSASCSDRPSFCMTVTKEAITPMPRTSTLSIQKHTWNGCPQIKPPQSHEWSYSILKNRQRGTSQTIHTRHWILPTQNCNHYKKGLASMPWKGAIDIFNSSMQKLNLYRARKPLYFCSVIRTTRHPVRPNTVKSAWNVKVQPGVNTTFQP